jgi:hypothetical protein
VVPMGVTNLLAYAAAGHAKATPLEDAVRDPVYGVSVKHRQFMPPYRRFEAGPGAFVENVTFGKFMYKWDDYEVILYVAEGRDGVMSYPAPRNHYILTANEHKVDALLKNAAIWGSQLHNEVWVRHSIYLIFNTSSVHSQIQGLRPGLVAEERRALQFCSEGFLGECHSRRGHEESSYRRRRELL